MITKNKLTVIPKRIEKNLAEVAKYLKDSGHLEEYAAVVSYILQGLGAPARKPIAELGCSLAEIADRQVLSEFLQKSTQKLMEEIKEEPIQKAKVHNSAVR